VTLGLAEADGVDGWDRRFTYRVHPTLVADNIMDMSQCDPAGSGPTAAGGGCVPGCTNSTLSTCTTPTAYLTGKGLKIKNVVGATLMEPPATGAAYVLISHGETGGGAYYGTGVESTSTTTDGNEEQLNYAKTAVVLQDHYVDDSLSEVAGANHFDDLVSRPSVLAVISRASLGPRSH